LRLECAVSANAASPGEAFRDPGKLHARAGGGTMTLFLDIRARWTALFQVGLCPISNSNIQEDLSMLNYRWSVRCVFCFSYWQPWHGTGDGTKISTKRRTEWNWHSGPVFSAAPISFI